MAEGSVLPTWRDALNLAWRTVDAGRRNFDEAAASGAQRALAKRWDLSAIAVSDLQAYALQSFMAKSDLLDGTWKILAKRIGWLQPMDGDAAQASIAKDTQGSPVLSSVVPIVIGVLGVVAGAALAIWIVSRASLLIDHELARFAQERELLRLHAEAQAVIEAHNARELQEGRSIPYSPDETAILDRLARAQEAISQGLAIPEETGIGAGGGVGIGFGLGVLVAVGLLFVLATKGK